ncbi:MAG: hypothetical protein JW384_00302 [Nitrosomonadaceae bacterium]|nr:hypothetical protein [Nitrosomonadaceae bacterium]
MSAFEEVAAEVGTIRQLLAMTPPENIIDCMSLQSRIAVVIEKATLRAAKEVVRIIKTPPKGFSDESEECGLWWTVDAERAVEDLVRIVNL